jgi:hypothetical protein
MPPLNPNINAGRDALTQSLMGNQGQGLGQMGAGTAVAQLGAGLPPGLGAMPPSNPAMGGIPPGLGGSPFAGQMGAPGTPGMMQPAPPMAPTPNFNLGGVRGLQNPYGTTTGANILGTPGQTPRPFSGAGGMFGGRRNPMAAMGGMFGRR